MTLDLLTLTLTLMSVSAICTFVMFVIWRVNQDMAGVFPWLLGTLFIALSFLAIFAANLLQLPGNPDAFISNSLSLPAVMLVVEGSLRFRGYHSRNRLRLGLVLVPLFVIMAWINKDNPQARFLFHDAVAAIGLFAAAGVMLFRTEDRAERLANSLAAVSALLLSLGFVMRWLVALTASDPALIHIDMPSNLLLYFMMIVFSVGWTFGVSVACYFRSHREVMQLAREDALTGLPNRRSIDEILGRAVLESTRNHRPFAVIMMDINEFKHINDIHGHSVGDEVLAGIAHRLKDHVRDADYTGRLGGDEFIVIAFDLDAEADAVMAANAALERLKGAIEGPLPLSVGECDVQISAGLAVWPEDGETVDQLLSMADRRMYRDKEAGKITEVRERPVRN